MFHRRFVREGKCVESFSIESVHGRWNNKKEKKDNVSQRLD